MSSTTPTGGTSNAPGSLLTPELQALIGVKGDTLHAAEPVEAGAIRRFVHAVMIRDPLFSDPSAAAASRYDGVVAPPLFPIHAIRRPLAGPDPLDALADDVDDDGSGGGMLPQLGLPPLPVSLKRLLNGGNEVEIYELARVGDVIAAQSTIVDIQEKSGSSGPFLLAWAETTYWTTNRPATLMKSRATLIFR